MCRLLLDTNILLDVLIPARPEHAEATELIDRCNGWGEFGMTCSLSLKDVYYVATKIHGEKWARTALKMLTGLLVVAPVDSEVCLCAVESNEPDFEDGIIRSCAELNGADFIITRDKDAFANSRVRSVSAAEYLKIAKANDAGYPWDAE